MLVFHGVGGIGRTTLSRTLEAALADTGRRPSQWGAPGWPADGSCPYGSAVGQVTGALIGALRERRQTVRALAGCAQLADLLEAETDLDALAFQQTTYDEATALSHHAHPQPA